jgi:DNA (cytosine-5)-methyltransferase 1
VLTPQFLLGIDDELIVDLFAGGGGMSTAIELATGRAPDIAINHNDDALSMHRANHPQTRHFVADVFEVDPKGATQGRPVGLLHLSPDCTHHSQAKGGQPRNGKIRALSWVAVRWAGQVRPRLITLENVTQIQKWGPLIAKRDHATGRVVKLDGTVAAKGEYVPLREQFLVPDKKREGQTWAKFRAVFASMGYNLEARPIGAADHGAGTTRERLFMVARCDGEAIVWPDASFFKKPKRGQKKWVAAADGIDFSIRCPSIFGRKKDLAEATLRRVAKGIKKYVLDSADPFIVPVTHQGGDRTRDIREPAPTVTAAHRGELMLCAPHLQQITQSGRTHSAERGLPVVTTAKGGEQALCTATLLGVGGRAAQTEPRDASEPHFTTTGKADAAVMSATLVQIGYGERAGQSPRAMDAKGPLGVVVAGGGKHALVSAFLAQHNTMPNGGIHAGHDAREPSSAITATGSQQGLVAVGLAHLRGNCDSRDAADPLQTVSAGGEHHGVIAAEAANESLLTPEQETGALRVAAFLIRYYGEGGQWGNLRDPISTMTTKDRLALVTVWIKGHPYVIVDIGLRMLTPRELYNCQGFPKNYIIERGHDGRVFSKSKQVRMCGNSVSPPPARALIAANYRTPAQRRIAA